MNKKGKHSYCRHHPFSHDRIKFMNNFRKVKQRRNSGWEKIRETSPGSGI